MSIQCEWSFSFYPVPVNCTDGQIRLRGGTSVREGRVEICISGVWGTICDSLWDSREARVVCRQLGFLSIGENAKSTLLVLECKKYTPGRGKMLKLRQWGECNLDS